MYSKDIIGQVTVELLDPYTEKIKYRQDINNVMMNSNLEYWRSFQKATWQHFNYNNNGGYSSTAIYSPIRASNILLTDDSNATTASDNSLSGNIIAWASRWPIGSPTGKRGNVVPSLCSSSYNLSKWVFEWAPSNGNGTFSSVSWAQLNSDNGYYGDSEVVTSAGSGWSGAKSNSSTGGGYNSYALHYNPSSGKTYTAYFDSAGRVIIAEIDPTYGGTPTVVITSTTTFVPTVNGSYTLRSLILVNGYFYFSVEFANFSVSTNAGIYRMQFGVSSQSAAGVLTGLNDAGAFSSPTLFLETDGTFIYAISSENSTQFYKIPIATPGSYTKTAISLCNKMVYRSGQLFLVSGFLYTINTSTASLTKTNNLNCLGVGSNFTETAVSPYAGSISARYGTSVNAYSVIETTSNTYSLPTSTPSNPFDFSLTAADATVGPNNEIWIRNENAIYKYSNKNVVSARALISPVTKTSSSTLRLTYNINFA